MEHKLIIRAKELLGSGNPRIVIVTHTNPDGDAVGSSLGLYACLHAAGFRRSAVIVPNAYPAFLHWLPHNDKVLNATEDPEKAEGLIMQADLVFCLDFNGLSRTDKLEPVLRKTGGLKLLIDHHPQPEDEFDLVISRTDVSSTAELVFEFIEKMGLAGFLGKDAADCLYTGIVTDTGSFSYACNNPETYLITARLIRLGVDGERIHRLVYHTYSADRMRLLGFCLSEKLVVMPAQETAYISLTKAEMERFNHRTGDTEGVVNYALSIGNISLAALFTENEDHIKVSFRSSGQVNVNQLARMHFNGGGHRNAAGGKSFEDMEKTLARFEDLVRSDGLDKSGSE